MKKSSSHKKKSIEPNPFFRSVLSPPSYGMPTSFPDPNVPLPMVPQEGTIFHHMTSMRMTCPNAYIPEISRNSLQGWGNPRGIRVQTSTRHSSFAVLLPILLRSRVTRSSPAYAFSHTIRILWLCSLVQA